MNRTNQQTVEEMERVRPILLSLAEAILAPAFRGHIDASDVVQQTLLEAYEKIDELSKLADAPLLGWLHSALKHNVLDAIRHQRTAKKDISKKLRLSDLEDSFIRMEHLLVADDTSPSQVLQRKEDITHMLAALQLLPPNQRMAIILKHLRGCTLREVSEMLQISEAAVAGLLHRGRTQLLRSMAESSDG